MDALSPRSANIQVMPKSLNEKGLAPVEAQKVEEKPKEKEHASPPPPWVLQPPLKPGLLAEKFQTGNFLGKGGFAICYEGELRGKKNGPGNCKFAMKIVKANMPQTKISDKFRTELQIHAKMRHPNIVQFHRAFTFKENTYVILELCPNGSVMDMMKKRKGLTLPEVRRHTVQICGAIKYMHARNVIHRDLKMGNLFLDRDMNIKLGDFGLAAILATKEECKDVHNSSLARRTTVCGTPNYIAPEILKKGKAGHDLKVDIWSIGVIVYAMLTGCPPFQSNSQKEIYEKVRDVKYDWPHDNRCINDIPDEAKDLVACLLKEDAEQRPEPDEIVSHPFFSMHGGSAIPLNIEASCHNNKPSWLKAEHPRGDVMDKSCSVLPLSTLAVQCGVGHLPGNEKPFKVVGGNVELSLFKECLEEEKNEAYPRIPLPKDMVYTSQTALIGWPSEQAFITQAYLPATVENERQITIQDPAAEDDELQMVLPPIPRRAPVQSHAATLRAAQFSSMPSRKVTFQSRAVARGETGSAKPPISYTSTLRTRRGLLNELPMRSVSDPSDARNSETFQNRKPVPRTTRSKAAISSIPHPKPKAEPNTTNDQPAKPVSRIPEKEKRRGIQEKRIVSNVIDELAPIAKRETSNSNGPSGSLPVRPNESSRSLCSLNGLRIPPSDSSRSLSSLSGQPVWPGESSKKVRGTLISPKDKVECISASKPEEVLENLQEIWTEIDKSLRKTTTGLSPPSLVSILIKQKNIQNRPTVTKWVDYTNKHGLGYVLTNGAVGCVFKADATSPQSCILVANAEAHLEKREIASYPEKQQVVPKNGPPVEFVENCAEEGLKRVLVPAAEFQLKIGADGIAEKMGPGTTAFDFEKRKKVSYWGKFGKYMTQKLGKSEEELKLQLIEENTSKNGGRKSQRIASSSFVRFYQRLGNVGIWGYGDGSFQFNFPDHTKILISDKGAWVDFYHLPNQAADSVRKGVQLDLETLGKRSSISYPTAVMVRGFHKGADFKDIIAANDFLAKLEFVKQVVGIWLKCGGLGCLGKDKYLAWEGVAEAGRSLVWVSVGSQDEDVRYRKPEALE
ncbi:Cell cycle serine/threonine-protein kinase cdc5/MSD2 [Pseudocyphellaria aurata]|nr:Cell cycle serine/threonine-protein kinase cdc5/MSD2 [Pseudocyphellaria aurata]